MLAEDQKWYSVSLRFMGDQLSVDQLEDILDITPSYIGRLGEHIRGNPKYVKHHTNIWLWNVPSEDNIPFETQVAELLSILEPKKEEVEKILAMAGMEGEIHLGFGSENGQGGAHFSAELIKRIAILGLDIDLDLYPPDIDEKEEESL